MAYLIPDEDRGMCGMVAEPTRAALVQNFALILAAHGEDRVQAGLAVLRVMREVGVTSWFEVFPALAKWGGLPGFRLPNMPGATYPERVVVAMARRLDDVPAADLAELAVLVAAQPSQAGHDRAQALHCAWNERQECEFQAEQKVFQAHLEQLAASVRRST